MRLVFAGTPEVAVPALEALLASRHEVVGVITRPDAPSGRGRTLTASPVKERALAAGLEVLTPTKPSDPDFQARLTELAPDCIPIVAYGALVPPSALGIPSRGWVNLHFSLLPAWRGAAPVKRSVLAGDEITGATTFQLEAGLDTGPVFGVITETIRASDTSGDLLARLAVSGAGLLVATMDGIEDGSLVAVPQPPDGVSYAAKLNPDDVRVDWSTPALHVDRLIRAGTPAPGPWTTHRDKRLKLGPVTLAPDAEPLGAGHIRLAGKSGVFVGTGSVPVRLGEVRSEGKPVMAADAWARGVRLGEDDRLV
ncbi:MAG: methionyl-tRNA formyltransferase [Frankiaceae bacterium]|nr:methionyl-tRNA formyltransferase [Frankiaceae bacterium]